MLLVASLPEELSLSTLRAGGVRRVSWRACFPLPLSLFSELASPQVPLLQDHIVSLFRDVFSEESVPPARSGYRRGSRAESWRTGGCLESSRGVFALRTLFHGGNLPDVE